MQGFFILYKVMDCVYIIYSEKLRKFYTGYTSNYEVRMQFHLNPESRKFTYNASDWTTFLIIQCTNKSQGLAIEKHIKAMKSSVYIKNLVKYPEMVEKLKSKYNF